MIDIQKLDVFFSAQSFNDDELRDKTVVVIDVLRATSTIVTAIKNGAKAIIPVQDMGEASKIAQNVDSDQYLLCGEKDGITIEGYDLGNSPFEYTPETIANKTIILNTTNGTKALKKTNGAKNIYIAAFLNLSRVLDAIRKADSDIVLICAGWQGRLSLEDMLLAGNIIHALCDGKLPAEARDGAKISFSLYEKFGGDLENVILNSNHAIRLKNLVGATDISYCCNIDTCDVLPILKDGMITNQNV